MFTRASTTVQQVLHDLCARSTAAGKDLPMITCRYLAHAHFAFRDQILALPNGMRLIQYAGRHLVAAAVSTVIRSLTFYEWLQGQARNRFHRTRTASCRAQLSRCTTVQRDSCHNESRTRYE